VLLGAGGVALGYPILDPIVGLGITVAILFIVMDSTRSMWRRMMDAIEPEIVESIETAAEETAGVEQVESVRARWVGHRIHSELRIRVNADLNVAEGHEVSERVAETVRRATPKLERLTVEVEPGL
jgi:divalent metal cation (Fe/Co/Zn/Cd) transporter